MPSSSLAVFYVEQVALNRHVVNQSKKERGGCITYRVTNSKIFVCPNSLFSVQPACSLCLCGTRFRQYSINHRRHKETWTAQESEDRSGVYQRHLTGLMKFRTGKFVLTVVGKFASRL